MPNPSPTPSDRAEKDQRENLAARLFLADREQSLPGPFTSLPERVKGHYRTLAQVAEHEFARRARQVTPPAEPEGRPGFKKSTDECAHLVVDEHVVHDRVVASRCCDCGKRGV